MAGQQMVVMALLIQTTKIAIFARKWQLAAAATRLIEWIPGLNFMNL